MKHHDSFDHHAKGRVYFINEGNDRWAVNDVTDMRSPKAAHIRGASEMIRKFPSRWVAFAATKEAAIEAAEADAKEMGERE